MGYSEVDLTTVEDAVNCFLSTATSIGRCWHEYLYLENEVMHREIIYSPSTTRSCSLVIWRTMKHLVFRVPLSLLFVIIFFM